MASTALLHVEPLGFPWQTIDPFLFCVHHDDAYPQGNGRYGPAASLAGRDIGQDFGRKDGWSMYHGHAVPGFPSHPHRGFETVTIVRQGLTDHSDSLGAAARFGGGDVQWLTAGRGIVHAEMFPLLDTSAPNPLELFQIWLNLPARSKLADPHFTMLWAEDIPHRVFEDAHGRTTELAVIAGALEAPGAPHLEAEARPGAARVEPLAPPPDSWAALAEAEVAIWTLRMAPHARWRLPPAQGAATRRKLYFFEGATATVAGEPVPARSAVEVRATEGVEIVNGAAPSEWLLLQGRPIGEPVAQYGPFVMNTEAELRQAFADYHATGFGGWPWPEPGPVHGPEPLRFARHADGRVETLVGRAGAAARRVVMRNDVRADGRQIAGNGADVTPQER
jgi:redox-sensitive bicupin YhaK (pirin superfamily)